MSNFTGCHYIVGREIFDLINVLRSVDDTDHFEAWDNIEEYRRQSMYTLIEHVLDNPDMTPEQMHIEWMNERLSKGWVYGEVTDRSNKIHNCLVPYEDLSELQKAKDAIVIHIVNKHRDFLTKTVYKGVEI